jgi:hypothetical protein
MYIGLGGDVELKRKSNNKTKKQATYTLDRVYVAFQESEPYPILNFYVIRSSDWEKEIYRHAFRYEEYMTLKDIADNARDTIVFEDPEKWERMLVEVHELVQRVWALQKSRTLEFIEVEEAGDPFTENHYMVFLNHEFTANLHYKEGEVVFYPYFFRDIEFHLDETHAAFFQEKIDAYLREKSKFRLRFLF